MSSVAAIIQHGKYFYKISIKARCSVWRVLDIFIRLRIKLNESIETTHIYTKLNFDQLKNVATTWPEVRE